MGQPTNRKFSARLASFLYRVGSYRICVVRINLLNGYIPRSKGAPREKAGWVGSFTCAYTKIGNLAGSYKLAIKDILHAFFIRPQAVLPAPPNCFYYRRESVSWRRSGGCVH